MCLVKQKNVLDFFHLCIVKNAPICYTAQKQQYTCPLEPISKIPRVSKSNFFTEPMEFAGRLPVPMKNFKFARFRDAGTGSPSLPEQTPKLVEQTQVVYAIRICFLYVVQECKVFFNCCSFCFFPPDCIIKFLAKLMFMKDYKSVL